MKDDNAKRSDEDINPYDNIKFYFGSEASMRTFDSNRYIFLDYIQFTR